MKQITNKIEKLFKRQHNRRLVLSLLLSAFLFILPQLAFAAAIDIPCRPSTQGTSDLYICVNQIYKYALVICSIAAVMMIMFAGYMYIFSGGSDKKVATAKSLISTSLIGIAVLLVGFLLLKQINPSLNTIKSITPTQINQQAWFDSDENDPVYNGGGNGGGDVGTVGPPSGDAQTLAKQLISSVGLNCFYGTQVSGVNDSASARDNIQQTANGQPASRSSYGNAPGGTVPLDSKMLGALVAMQQKGINICTVNALAGGSHSQNSAHYRGKAFDIQTDSPSDSRISQMKSICTQLGASLAQYEPSKSGRGHVHCQWP